jgi:hypothetical protein
MDEPALGVGLDREDINYLVAQNLGALEASKFWMGESCRKDPPPIVAIWPIENRTSQHIEDQLVTILSSIETTFVNSGEVRVVARNEQENLADEIRRQSGSMSIPRTRSARAASSAPHTSSRAHHGRRREALRRAPAPVQPVPPGAGGRDGLVRWQHEVTRSKQLKR